MARRISSQHWTGRMRTAYLNDRQIKPTEYTKWAHAHQRFARRRQDQRILAHLKATIPARGLDEPITLGVSDRDQQVYVADGHHRAVALLELGEPSFPFRWYWIRNFNVRIENAPLPADVLDQLR